MRACFCGARADFICHECGMLACYAHVYVKHEAWGLVCPKNRESNHMFFPFISEEVAKQPPPVEEEPQKEEPPVAVVTEHDGFVAGQKLGVALTALLGGPQPTADMRALSYLGRIFSRLEGFADDSAFGFVDGFIAGVTVGNSAKQITAPKSAASE